MKKMKTVVSLFFALLFAFSLTVISSAVNTSGDYIYSILDNGTVQIDSYTGKTSTLTLPSELDGKKVTALGNDVFRSNNKVKKVVIPDGITTLGDTFQMNTSIESIKLGSGVKSISRYTFFYCTNLENISVSADNKYFSSANGILYNKAKTKLINVPAGKTMDIFEIPDGVKTIGSMAIRNAEIKELIIPSTVTKIESYAITIKEMKSLTIPGSVKTLEDAAVYACEDLVSISIEKGSLKKISNRAIDSCYNLKTVELPSNVTSVGIFYGCNSLEDFVVNKDNKYYSSDADGVLFNKDKTKIVLYPRGKAQESYTVPDSVEIIGESCFYEAKQLKSLCISKNVTEIQQHAYAYCADIDVIYFEGTKSQYQKIRGENNGNSAYDNKVKYNSHIHSYTQKVTKAATTDANGKIKCTCACGYSFNKTVYKIDTCTLSTLKYTYNAKKRTPSVTVKDSNGKTLEKNTDYTVTYQSGRKNPGKYTVKITFKGEYNGTKKLYFTIAPKAPKSLKSTSAENSITLTWSKVTGATGYRVYSYNPETKKYKGIKTVTSTKYKVENLDAGTKYYYVVRAYKKSGSTTIWSANSTRLNTATKPLTPKATVASKENQATISWNEVSGATGYVIYMSTSKDGTYEKIKAVKSNKLSFTKTELTKGKRYYFKVRTYIKNGKNIYSEYSSAVSVKIK